MLMLYSVVFRYKSVNILKLLTPNSLLHIMVAKRPKICYTEVSL